MTEYALAPNRKFTAESIYRSPRVMLAEGLLAAYRVRENGTVRHIDLVPLGSTARETAEWVSDRVDMDGASVQAVARELHISTPTVRRILEALELTEEIESGDWDGLHFDSTGAPVFDTACAEDEEGAEDTAADLVEDISDLLDNAPSVADLIEANSKGTDVAPRPARTTRTRRPRATDAELLERNRARFAPARRAAAQTAPAPAAAATPAPAPQPAPQAPSAPVGARPGDLAVCFCSGLGQHAPGATGCKYAVARRPRSH
jgi:hypothetical protein